MHGEGYRGHLPGAVLKKDRRLLIHSCRCRFPLAQYAVRRLFHKAPHNAERVHANVEHGAPRQIPVKKAILHIVFFKTAEIDSDHLDSAQLAALHNTPQLLVQRHVPDRHRLGQDESLALCKRGHLIKFLRIEGDRLFYKQMLAVFERFLHKPIVRVMGAGNVDDIHIVVHEHFVDRPVDLFNAVLFGKSDCL